MPGAAKSAGANRDWRARLAQVAPGLAGLPVSEAAARALMAHAHWPEAEAALQEVLARDPLHVGALRALAQVQRLTGQGDASARTRQRALDAEAARLGLQGADRAAAAEFFFAVEGGHAQPLTTPPALVARQFDLYADYDEHLVERLRYRAPEVLEDLVKRQLAPAPAALRILDAGCGTGLAGVRFRPFAHHLLGVDLSGAMIERARARGIYDALLCGDILAVTAPEALFDLVIAADVMPYVGALEPLMQGIFTRLTPGGAIAFTAEASASAGIELMGSRRFAHGAEHVRQALAAAGFATAVLESCVLRFESGEPVTGWAVCARRPTEKDERGR